MDPRQRVTDLQRLILFLAGLGAVFLAAMACGGSDAWLLLYAAGLVVLVGGIVLGQVVRRGMMRHQVVTARVLSASAPRPNTGIQGRCDLRLEVSVPGRGRVEARHRAESVALVRWPQPGQLLPVQISGGSTRRLHVRWDLLEAGVLRERDAEPAGTQGPVWENEDEAVVYSPTPPRPRRSATQSQSPPGQPQAHLHEAFTDLNEATEATQPRPAVPYAQTVASNGNDPDGYDPHDFERVEVREVDPANIDLSDFLADEDPGASMASPPPDEPRAPNDSPPIPQPRDGAEQFPRDEPPPPAARILPHGPAGVGLDATLPVADLARSLHFYHDLLGFTITFMSPDSAVVESAGTRIMLDHVGDPAARRAQADQVHLQVTDIESTCAALARSGVDIIDEPATVDTDGVQLWRATVTDPDGHEVELVEWRQRPATPR